MEKHNHGFYPHPMVILMLADLLVYRFNDKYKVEITLRKILPATREKIIQQYADELLQANINPVGRKPRKEEVISHEGA